MECRERAGQLRKLQARWPRFQRNGKLHYTNIVPMNAPIQTVKIVPLGVGYYTVPEASRLLKIAPRSIYRWLGGYKFEAENRTVTMPPLWIPELPAHDHRLELSFRDLIELRFIKAFIQAGLGLQAIRACLDYAKECVADERPFSTRKFRTDGRTIFLESARRTGESELLDLREHQFVIKDVIARTFRDLDIDEDAVARWRPYRGKQSIVIDPQRAFGQPIAAMSGIPTVALADAVKVEGSIQRVAQLFEVAKAVVQDAINFEKSLAA
jgi:uncharacterized protein (DUF433 family)